jgi:hypothetical protein
MAMHEWKNIKKSSRSGEQPELDERLAAYYGPVLHEQPLSSASWQRLRSQLVTPHSLRHRYRLRLRGRRHRGRSFVPAYVQETFSRISYEARVSYPQSLLQCSLNPRVHAPVVRVSTLGRHKIKLVLPSAAEGAIGQTGLDVLVATGLARYLWTRKPEYVIARVLLAVILLASIASLVFWKQNHLVLGFPIVTMLCVSLLLHMQGRRLAFRADSLIVLWLGRERACRGLHALAACTPRSSRQAWGEPSLVERIHRVCGTRVAVEDERLTLVR